MKIVFWAPVHGQTRQSSNMLAVALTMAMQKKRRILVTQTHFQLNDFEDAIAGRSASKEMREKFYQGIGIDAVQRCIKRKPMEENDLENCCIQILSDAELLLLPGTNSGSYEIHSEALNEMMSLFLREAERYFDCVLIDVCPGRERISRRLMEEADVVVVNLSQNVGVTDPFFWDFPKELEEKKVFYLIGSYLPDSSYNLHNLRFRYRKITRSNSGVIPLNVGYMDAISAGKTVDFFEANKEPEPGDSNYKFITEVQRVVERLIRFSGMV